MEKSNNNCEFMLEIFSRDKGECKICGKQAEIPHIIEKNKNVNISDYTRNNAISLCEFCSISANLKCKGFTPHELYKLIKE
jgi:5-methylcytosine-specific restriction endonuclease McrA